MTGKNQLYELLVKDLTSEITEEEKKRLTFEIAEKNETDSSIQLMRDFWSHYFPKPISNQVIQKTEKKLGFTYSSKSRINAGLVYKIAATVLLVISLGYIGYQYFSPKPEVSLNEYITGSGQVKNIVLSDGTKVWLNAQSALIVSEPFINGVREVLLVGEGYFEVAPNPEKPFIVKTQNLKTKVLGTHFNITAYIDDPKHKILLYEGKIELSAADHPENKMMVEPGEKIIYTRTAGEFDVYITDLGAPAEWRDGILRFYDEDLSSISKVLERRFNTKIIVADDKVGNLHFTANFDEEPLEKIIKLLQEAHDFDFKKLENSIIIQSKQIIYNDHS